MAFDQPITRRGALLTLFGGAVSAAAACSPAGQLLEGALVEEAFASGLLDLDFSKRADSPSWSTSQARFLTRFAARVSVKDGRGLIRLPETRPSSGDAQAVPVFLLDKDLDASTQRLRFSVSDKRTKPGLLFGATNLFDYHAVTVEGGHLVLSRFARSERVVLARVAVSDLVAGVNYELVVNASAGQVRARFARVGHLPAKAQLTAAAPTSLGMGGVLLVGEPSRPATKLSVSRYQLNSGAVPVRTPMRETYLLAGAPKAASSYVRVGVERPAEVVVEWAEDAAFTSGLGQSAPKSVAAAPYAAKAEVPAGHYWRARLYDAVNGDRQTTPTQYLPTFDATKPLVLGAASCAQLWRMDDYLGFTRLVSEAAPNPPALLTYQGDFGYPSNSHYSCLQTEPDFYEDRILRFLRDPHFVNLRTQMATAFTMDDHEYGPQNNCDRTNLYPWTYKLWNKMHADPSTRGYYDWRYGDVHCLTLDGRRYSDPVHWAETSTKTKLGQVQKQWLKDTLNASDASLFVIFSADIFATRGSPTKSLDCWSFGWSREYKELMSFFHKIQLAGKRVLIVSGDAHGQRVHNHPDPKARTGATPVVEFICSGLRARTWSMEHAPDPTLDPARRVAGKNGLGMLVIDPAFAPARSITVRAVNGDPGGAIDLFPPLVLSFAP